MHFRPCIDIHNGAVKQIVGSSLNDAGDTCRENFVSRHPAADYAELYRRDGLSGGHVILLNAAESPYYEETKRAALSALKAYPLGLMAGGGITDQNAAEFLDAGASHVIVTSFVFRGGRIDMEHLRRMTSAVGRNRLVLDLSCRKRDNAYFVVTDRWQTFTETRLTAQLFRELSGYCSEFLVHAADAEGKQAGIETDVASVIAAYLAEEDAVPVTYAGGIRSEEDIALLGRLSDGKCDFTAGSALDLFGGHLSYERLARIYGQ